MMAFLHGFVFLIGGGIAGTLVLFRKGGIYNPVSVQKPSQSTKTIDLSTDGGQIVPPEPSLSFDTPQEAWVSVRVLCDSANLTKEDKDELCACIFQESRFNNKAINYNRNKDGIITSTDWGICQINDYFHCGVGKDFPSSAYVVANPQDAVEWMIKMDQEGLLKLWVSYSSGAYKQWLPETSPMWKLAVV